MIIPLLKHNLSSAIKIFFLLFALICLYTITIIYMYNPELSDMLSGYQDVLPGMMSAVGMTGIASNLLEWIQIYLYGFIMELFPMIFVIVLGNRLIMSHIDTGSMANLLSTPHSRFRIIFTQLISSILLITCLLSAVTAVGIISSHILFPGELDIARYIQLNVSTLLLQLIILGIVCLAACVCNEARYYYTFGAGIPIIFFLLQMLSNMGEKLEKLKYVTIYTLLPAKEIIHGESYWIYNLSMILLALALFSFSIFWFDRRDLSI